MLYHLGTENKKVMLFIDIIGFGELVKANAEFDANSGNPHGIALMFPAFYDSLSKKYSKEWQARQHVNFLWASDTIVISTDTDKVNVLVEELIYLQNQFYCRGMAFRGVITIGNLYHKENIWGEPLVRAAEIEKTIVKFPRVIISKDEYSKLQIGSQFKGYFIQDELNDEFLSFSVFKPSIDIILNNPKAYIHATLNVYDRLVVDNFEKAPEKVKNRWKWMAKELCSVIDNEYKKIECKLKLEEDKGYANCNLEEIKNILKNIMQGGE